MELTPTTTTIPGGNPHTSFFVDNPRAVPPAASRSFVLAALRALHLDPANAPSRPRTYEEGHPDPETPP
jgi:hypothetical protein